MLGMIAVLFGDELDIKERHVERNKQSQEPRISSWTGQWLLPSTRPLVKSYIFTSISNKFLISVKYFVIFSPSTGVGIPVFGYCLTIDPSPIQY